MLIQFFEIQYHSETSILLGNQEHIASPPLFEQFFDLLDTIVFE